jgi:hypothetical protein
MCLGKSLTRSLSIGAVVLIKVANDATESS